MVNEVKDSLTLTTDAGIKIDQVYLYLLAIKKTLPLNKIDEQIESIQIASKDLNEAGMILRKKVMK